MYKLFYIHSQKLHLALGAQCRIMDNCCMAMRRSLTH